MADEGAWKRNTRAIIRSSRDIGRRLFLLRVQLGPALDKFFAEEKQRGRNHNVLFRDASKDKSAAPATLLLNLLDAVAY